jgi:acetyl esterase
VYYHGGGWVSGSIAETETIARKLAERTSSAVALVDYRLAPENPYPAAVDDSYAALQWVADHLHEIANEDALLMVAGDDAGGTLAAVVAMLARDCNGPTISTQILICPILDSSSPDSAGAEADDAGWVGPSALRWYWDQYVPDPTARAAAAVTPLEAGDLSGLPPAVIVTAEYSPARFGAEMYAQRLREAGVDVEEKLYEGQVHNFAVVLSMPMGERVFQQVIRTVRGRWMRARRNSDRALKTMEESTR